MIIERRLTPYLVFPEDSLLVALHKMTDNRERTVFVVDPNKNVRMMMIYPPSAGRSFHEILRVIDSLQLTDRAKVSTPVNWEPGDRAIIAPSVSDEQAKAMFPQGGEAKKPYLRYVEVK